MGADISAAAPFEPHPHGCAPPADHARFAYLNRRFFLVFGPTLMSEKGIESMQRTPLYLAASIAAALLSPPRSSGRCLCPRRS